MASAPDASRAALGKMGNLKQLQKSLRTYVSKTNLSDASVILDKLDKLMDDESEEEMAAMEIQRCFRGHAGRQYFTVYRNNKIRSNVQTIQRLYRGHLGRKLFRFLHNRANAVQRVWKGHLGRKLAQLRREFCGARRLQMAYRCHIARNQFTNAASIFAGIVLKRVLRKTLIRITFLRRLRIHKCTSIQRVLRGHRARNVMRWEMRKLKDAKLGHEFRCARVVQKATRGHWSRVQFYRKLPGLRLARRIRSSVKVQRVFRGFLGRLQFRCIVQLNLFERYSRCVVPIQSLGRGYIARKLASKLYMQKMEGKAMKLAQSLFARKKERKAIAIQRFWRNYKKEQFYKLQVKSACKIQLWFRLRNMKFMGEQFRKGLHKKANVIQKCYRGRLARIRYKIAWKTSSILRIQAVYRGHRGRIAAVELSLFLRRRQDRLRARAIRVQQKLEVHRSVLAKDTSTMLQIVKVAPKPSANSNAQQPKNSQPPVATRDVLARSQDLASGILSVPESALSGGNRAKLKSSHGYSLSQAQIVPAYLAGKFSQLASASEDNPLFQALGADAIQSYADESHGAFEAKAHRETKAGNAAESSDTLPPLSKVPPSMLSRQIVPRYLQDDIGLSGNAHAAAPAVADNRSVDAVPGPLRAHDRREAAVLMRLANSLPAGIVDMAPVSWLLLPGVALLLVCLIRSMPVFFSCCMQEMAAKVAESLGLLPFDLQADLGYMQHRSSL
jgi:hypothetical protein